jgi:hypothetical protein
MKPWHEWDFITLSEEAERGRVGQGAVVDAMRRVVKSVDQFSKVSTWLAGAMIGITRACRTS